MEGYRATTYGDGFADVYDDWYADVSSPTDTATFVAARASGCVVELGSGTGRLAGPLAATGAPVAGVDASLAMLVRSRARFPDVPVVVADMADPPLRRGSAGAVLIAFNTLFNLPSVDRQRDALARAAQLVAPDGAVIVEAFVPGEGALAAGDHVDVARLDADLVVLRVSRTDPVAGTVSGHHVELRDGHPVRLRPWHLCFTDPGGMDRLAAEAGLALTERYADWREGPFDDTSSVHVSVYRPAEPRR